tara:strand:+ start:34 stop:324 length:291 start_codon:yes stop_codon:yes gene_type:complete
MKSTDSKLILGNLFLAGFLSLVPTAITMGTFYLYGINLCSNIPSKTKQDLNTKHRVECFDTVRKLNYQYIFFIWLVITTPTWFWFYLNHSKLKNIK